MAVDLSDLMAPALPRKSRASKVPKAHDSVAGVVDKSAVLAMVEQLEANASSYDDSSLSDAERKCLALEVAHDEDVSAWCEAIAHWMQQYQGKKVSLLQLQQALGVPLVEIWLGLLHSTQYQWESTGDFYKEARDIWIGN